MTTCCSHGSTATLGTEAASFCTNCGAATVGGASVSLPAVLLSVIAAAAVCIAVRQVWRRAAASLLLRRLALA